MTAPSHTHALAPCPRLRDLARQPQGLSVILLLVILQTALLMPEPVDAAIFKCVSASGDITYTSTPCAHDESTRRISANATAVAGLDCRIARKLAFDTTRRMKQGETSESVFNSHGGMDSLSPEVMGLISYIYTFHGNEAVSASRIATLATERCQVGSFGANVRRCEFYPYEFIQTLGGCAAARDETAGDTAEPVTGAALPASYAPPAPAASIADPQASASRMAAQQQSACRQRINGTLENTQALMQQGASAVEQTRLRAQQRQLRMQLARC